MSVYRLSSRGLVGLAVVGLVGTGLAACGSSSPSSSSSTASASSTLTMESSPETTITDDFNPFISTGAPYGMGATGLIYEPLLQFDVADPPKYYPWLATGYSWSNSGKSITFTIRQGVKFSNGTPMTPADVVYSYQLVQKNAAINTGGLPITSVTSSGNDVTVNFSSAEYTNLQTVAGVAILPEAIWSKAGNPATFTDPKPVGTGPYVLKSFTAQGFTLTKNPNYWQPSKVNVDNVYFPVYTSNTGALSALFSGAITWTGNFIPGLQKQFVSTAPTYHHFWEAATSSNALIPNLSKWPTNQLAVRQAISLAVDRSLLASEGEAGLENPITNSSGLTLPTYSAWAAPAASDTISTSANAAAADKVLTAAGYKKNSAGYYALNGREVDIPIIAPSAYTDYAENGSLVAGELKAAGINATFSGISVNSWDQDFAVGDFTLAEHWSSQGVTPYNLYDNWLDDSLNNGKANAGDYEGLKDAAIETDLHNLAGDQTTAEQITDLTPIIQYVAANLPVIPVTTASAWFEYNSKDFVGWPTQQDPYEIGQPTGSNTGGGAGTDEVVILHLKPRS